MGGVFGRSATPAAMEFVKQTISSNKVVVFSKTYCPYCRAAKVALAQEGAVMEVVELDQRDDGGEIQAALADLTGRRTVPNVFFSGKSIGGGDDTVALQKSGKLREMLSSVGALKGGYASKAEETSKL